ncbi:hypothetical protein Fmac_031175 [Flemingia macrophylla]|uniref:Uncharacterized protein n=1 Tax=Flemingia macrophylla TaxID=520843 RepID=A0ABD1L1B1_9FABA
MFILFLLTCAEREGTPGVFFSDLNDFSSNSSMELDIGTTSTYQTLDPWFQSDTSTGYLQDVIVGRDARLEEQNLPSCSKDPKVDQIPILPTTTHPLNGCGITYQKEFFTANQSSSPESGTHEALQHADCGFTHQKNFITTNQNQLSSPQSDKHEALQHADRNFTHQKNFTATSQNQSSLPQSDTHEALQHADRGFTHQKYFITTNQNQSSLPKSNTLGVVRHDPASGKRRKIAYPFEIVKSGGVEGETTLKDINKMISLTTPSSSKPPLPSRVTRPCKLAPVMSKKQVTSLTRVPTRGTGSITITRITD